MLSFKERVIRAIMNFLSAVSMTMLPPARALERIPARANPLHKRR